MRRWMEKDHAVFPEVSPEAVNVDTGQVEALITYLQEETAAAGIPGFAMVATCQGKCFLEHFEGTYCGIGDKNLPFHRDVVHRAYSFSKPVSATVVMQLYQEGLLDIDLPVQAYIPEFTGGGKDALTLRHFLTHSAGLPSLTSDVPTEAAWQAAIEEACAAEVEWEPGSRTPYHARSSLFVPAAVARIVSDNMTWAQLCRERLFEPLGMNSSYFDMPPRGTPLSITPQPDEAPTSWDDMEFGFLGHPSGGLLCTTEDMMRFLNMHLNKGRWGDVRILEEATWNEMMRVVYQDKIDAAIAAGETPTHDYWALGWLTRGETESGWFGFGSKLDPTAFGHAGINTVIGIGDPTRDLAFSYLTSDSPPSDEVTVRLRNEVSNFLADAVPVLR